MAKLTTPGLAPSEKVLAELRRSLEDWLNEIVLSNHSVTALVLDQLDTVNDLLPYVGKPRQLGRKAVDISEAKSKRYTV